MTRKRSVGCLILVLFSIFSNRIHAENEGTYGITYRDSYKGPSGIQKFTVRFQSISTPDSCDAPTAKLNSLITEELRLAACKHANETIKDLGHIVNDIECYANGFNKRNLCAVRCPIYKENGCASGLKQYKTILLSDIPCAPNHFCQDGCCLENEVQDPVIIDTPTTTTTESTTTPSTTPVPDDIESIELTREFLEYGKSLLKDLHEIALYNFSKELFTCPRKGKFAPRHRTNHSRRYFDCRWVATVYQCPKGKNFDEQQQECVKKASPTQPEKDESLKEWSHLIECQKEGVFTSPYDCRYMYYCTSKHELSLGKSRFNVSFKKCHHHLVFNGEFCEYPDMAECNNKPIPTHHKSHSIDAGLE